MRPPLFAALALALAAFVPQAASDPASAQSRLAPKASVVRDWSRTVVATDQGFRMGNPAAKVKLVEYGSLGCSHCADFARTGKPALASRYVRGGKVSYEFRTMVLNLPDISASMLARCSGSSFFRVTDAMFAAQPAWTVRAAAVRVPAGSELSQAAAVAEASGLVAIAVRNGLPAARARTCLADQAGLERVIAITNGGIQAGVEGTPTFFLDGTRTRGNTWPAIEPLIRRAAG